MKVLSWIKVAMNGALGVTSDQRAVLTTELGGGANADQLVWVGKNTDGTYAKTVLAPIAPIAPPAPVTNPDYASLTVDGGIRAGGTSGTPTFTVSVHAGTASALTATAGGDAHGELTLTPGGTGIVAGTMVGVNFTTMLANAAYDVILMPRNPAAAVIGLYLAVRSTGSFVAGFASAPAAGTDYAFSWWVVGR